ncbi:serine/threonine-protein kinase [Bosea eneae]|uniref:Serine/threonine-protein kinase n=1 Tax=Bosea eneae TaxID=151454 RepID=A0ABW0ITD9_9HYPH
MDKVDEADRALAAFVSGRMPFERLVAALKSLVLGDGTALPVLARLESWANEGRLPSDLASLLAGELGGHPAAAVPEDAGLDPPTVPLAPPRPAAPDPAVALPPAGTIRDKVDEVVVNALIGDFAGLRGRNRTGEARSDPMLDASLADFRSLRFRRDASNAEAGRVRRFELDPRRETRRIGIGAMLKDRFILDAEIGRGGMGTVYRAVDRRRLEAMRHQPYVALKLLGGDFRHHPEALRTIEAEARRAQELAHPNIVTIHDFERDGSHLFIVMELLEGEPLDQRIARAGQTAVGWEEGREILEGLCAGLGHAHARGIIHADIKPANVFLAAGSVKLLDFGIASAARDGGFDPTSLGGLTMAYASPQMIETAERRTDDDVYALGCIAYELLAGRHPFDGKAAVEARERSLSPARPIDVEDKVWQAVAAALAFEREQRPADAAGFAKALFG